MTHHISPDSAKYIEKAIKNGAYSSETQAIDEAIGLLMKRDLLRADVRLGIEQADRGELLPADQVFARLEERAQKTEASAEKPRRNSCTR